MAVRNYLAQFFLWAHIIFAAIIFGGSIYETIVINSVWSAALPDSLNFMTNQQYSVNPGRFWQGFGRLPPLAILGALLFNWHIRARRKWILVSLVCMLINTLTTIFYFVPILRIIFAPDGGGRSGAELTDLANNWVLGTWGRMTLLLVSLIVSVWAMTFPLSRNRAAELVATDPI